LDERPKYFAEGLGKMKYLASQAFGRKFPEIAAAS
jgi:hypothetical protein